MTPHIVTDAIPSSEGLLTEILALLQDLHSSVESFKPRLDRIESEIQSINDRINQVIDDGFPGGNLSQHRAWHESIFHRVISIFRRG